MKSFKQLALAAAVLSASFMAQAELKSMDDASMSAVTGQAGISIAGDFSGTVGNVAYIDDGNKLNLSGISMTGFAIADENPLTIDVASKDINGVATQQLVIGLPAMKGTVTVANINIGGNYSSGTPASGNTPAVPAGVAGGTSIGGLAISDINMGGSAIRVWGH